MTWQYDPGSCVSHGSYNWGSKTIEKCSQFSPRASKVMALWSWCWWTDPLTQMPGSSAEALHAEQTSRLCTVPGTCHRTVTYVNCGLEEPWLCPLIFTCILPLFSLNCSSPVFLFPKPSLLVWHSDFLCIFYGRDCGKRQLFAAVCTVCALFTVTGGTILPSPLLLCLCISCPLFVINKIF